jgi:hypothetical protein
MSIFALLVSLLWAADAAATVPAPEASSQSACASCPEPAAASAPATQDSPSSRLRSFTREEILANGPAWTAYLILAPWSAYFGALFGLCPGTLLALGAGLDALGRAQQSSVIGLAAQTATVAALLHLGLFSALGATLGALWERVLANGNRDPALAGAITGLGLGALSTGLMVAALVYPLFDPRVPSVRLRDLMTAALVTGLGAAPLVFVGTRIARDRWDSELPATRATVARGL